MRKIFLLFLFKHKNVRLPLQLNFSRKKANIPEDISRKDLEDTPGRAGLQVETVVVAIM
jgi:hypothetical protein